MLFASVLAFAAAAAAAPAFPPSPVFAGIQWHWDTRQTAAPGSDLWPVAWADDDHLYTAWGDGGGFGGTDTDGRVAMGFGRLEGVPPAWHGFNLNGGKDPPHPASFPRKGKTSGLACVDGVLYATVNLQDGPWPRVNHVLAWSADRAATWERASWLFPVGEGRFHPAAFVGFGRDYTGLPDSLAGYVYVIGGHQSPGRDGGGRLYLARVPRTRLREEAAWEFYQGAGTNGAPRWSPDEAAAPPVFEDPNGVAVGSMVYLPAARRFLLTSYHTGPGQLGVFDAPEPWGPWTLVDYQEHWGGMGAAGEGLTCTFPQKWMSPDGLTLWAVFSAYGTGAKQGVNAHDCFNLLQATLVPLSHAERK